MEGGNRVADQDALLLRGHVGADTKDREDHRQDQVYGLILLSPHHSQRDSGHEPKERSHVAAHGRESTSRELQVGR